MYGSSSSQEAGPSALKTPVTDQSEWASSSTPSRQTFPRRLSLLQSESAVSSPIRTPTSASVDSQSQSQQQQQQQQNDRRTSFTGPKPLSLSSQPMTSSVSGEAIHLDAANAQVSPTSPLHQLASKPVMTVHCPQRRWEGQGPVHQQSDIFGLT